MMVTIDAVNGSNTTRANTAFCGEGFHSPINEVQASLIWLTLVICPFQIIS